MLKKDGWQWNSQTSLHNLGKVQNMDLFFKINDFNVSWRIHFKLLQQSPIHLQDDFFPGSIEAVKREDTFLSENPFDMLERGDFAHIPVIFGMNSAEGLIHNLILLYCQSIQLNIFFFNFV